MPPVQRTFGRRVEFDRRSRNFPIRALIARGTVPRSYTWSCAIVLDQGSTPACTGFSVTHEAAARPVPVPNLTNTIAQAVYRRAKQLDQWPGENYDGSSVLGAMKAGTERQWYTEYRWAFSVDDLILAVGYKGPAVLGIEWYEGMMQPDAKGIIRVAGKRVGGHAILCNGYNVGTQLFRLHNSWGSGWGKNGECFISKREMTALLKADGEACIPVVRRQP